MRRRQPGRRHQLRRDLAYQPEGRGAGAAEIPVTLAISSWAAVKVVFRTARSAGCGVLLSEGRSQWQHRISIQGKPASPLLPLDSGMTDEVPSLLYCCEVRIMDTPSCRARPAGVLRRRPRRRYALAGRRAG